MQFITLVLLFSTACQPRPEATDTIPAEDDTADTASDTNGTDFPPVPPISNPLDFTTATVLTETPGNAKTPTIASLPDGTVHTVWHDFSTEPANLYHGIWEAGEWTSSPLILSAEKSIRPTLLAQGNTLHLVFDVWAADTYTIHHATYSNDTWSTADPVAEGSYPSPAIDPTGDLHLVYLFEDGLAHSRRLNNEWVAGDLITTKASVNPFGHHALPGPDGISVAVSMGDCSSMICYDISLFNWNSEGWTNQVLLDSPYLSSDEPQGALMTNGDQAWTWAEQLPYDPWVTGIALISPLNSTAIVVSEDLSGFSSDPTIVVPGDDVPMVAWLSPTNSVLIDRYPFTQPTLLIEDAFGPALTVDASGYTHLVAYGYDSNNSQQIWHTTNHPD